MYKIGHPHEKLASRRPRSQETIEREMLSRLGVRLIITDSFGEMPASLAKSALGQRLLAAHRDYGDESVVLSAFFNPARRLRGGQLDP